MNAESMAGDMFSEGARNSINTLVNCSVLSQDLLCFKVLNLLILAGLDNTIKLCNFLRMEQF